MTDSKKGYSKPRTVVHVDMDAFYASIEQLDHPEYRDRPLVVGADPRQGKGRGVVSAASYEARVYGIHSAMPISHAFRRCPQAVFVKPRMQRYAEVSKKVMEILGEFSPVIEQISIDEAFLDCTGTETLFGPPRTLACSIKARMREKTSLSASVGVASNKSIAKIASEIGKPDGLVICKFGKEKEFLSELPLSFLWGAGKKTVGLLESLGYRNIGDVANAPPHLLVEKFGKNGIHLWNLANGIDERPIESLGSRKSISKEVTFDRDVSSGQYIENVLFKIADSLSRKMRGLHIAGRTVTLKIRLEGFQTYTRSRSFPEALNDMQRIREQAITLFRQFDRRDKKVRLVGIAVSNLEMKTTQCTQQLELFRRKEKTFQGKPKIDTDKLLDDLKQKYGAKVTRAVFLPGFFNKGDGPESKF
jgi:DNA polymerase-4